MTQGRSSSSEEKAHREKAQRQRGRKGTGTPEQGQPEDLKATRSNGECVVANCLLWRKAASKETDLRGVVPP